MGGERSTTYNRAQSLGTQPRSTSRCCRLGARHDERRVRRRARGAPPFLPTPRNRGRTRAAAWPWWARLVTVPCPARPEHPSLPSLCPRPERKTRWAPARNRRKRNAGGTRCLHAATEMEKKPPGTAPARSAPLFAETSRSMGRTLPDSSLYGPSTGGSEEPSTVETVTGEDG
jgi:hypothetical protein